jgi:hypothetical protein
LIFNDVCSITEVLRHEYNPDQWRLFIDSLKVSLKLVLLHDKNGIHSIILVHAGNKKKNYESLNLLLGNIMFDEFN